MEIIDVASIPEKNHVIHVVVLHNERGLDLPVRKKTFCSLGPENGPWTPEQLAYVMECATYHHPEGDDGENKRRAKRREWDADDEARKDAKRLADEEAERNKFVVTPLEYKYDANQNPVGVQVLIEHKGIRCEVVLPLDVADVREAAELEWQKVANHQDAMSRFRISE